MIRLLLRYVPFFSEVMPKLSYSAEIVALQQGLSSLQYKSECSFGSDKIKFPLQQEKEKAKFQMQNDQQIMIRLNSAQNVPQILQIYQQQQALINCGNVIYVIRAISQKLYTFRDSNKLNLQDNSSFQELTKFLTNNVASMNEYTLVEMFTLYRKLHSFQISMGNSMGQARKISQILDQMCEQHKVNAKICAQVFYEQALLGINAQISYQTLKLYIEDPTQKIYFTAHPLMFIIKACSILNHRKYADFCYKSTILLEPQLANLDVHSQSNIFKNICQLRLHLETTHKRMPQILISLKEQIIAKIDSLKEQDLLNLLEGYLYAPHTLDTSLLATVRTSVMKALREKPLSLSTDFIIRFIEVMSRQRQGYQIPLDRLTEYSNLLMKRLGLTTNIRLTLIEKILKAFQKTNFFHRPLYNTLYNKLLQVSPLTLTISIQIATMLLRQKFDCGEFLAKIYQTFQGELSNKHVEILLKLLYIYTYPDMQYNKSFEMYAQKIAGYIKAKRDSERTVQLALQFGSQYAAVKNTHFTEMQNWCFKVVQDQWNNGNLSPKDHCTLSTVFIASKHPPNLWNKFLIEKNNNLNAEMLNLLIVAYENSPTKYYNLFDLVIRSIMSSKEKEKCIKKIINFIIETPPSALLNKKGKPHQMLRELLGWLPVEPTVELMMKRTVKSKIQSQQQQQSPTQQTAIPLKKMLFQKKSQLKTPTSTLKSLENNKKEQIDKPIAPVDDKDQQTGEQPQRQLDAAVDVSNEAQSNQTQTIYSSQQVFISHSEILKLDRIQRAVKIRSLYPFKVILLFLQKLETENLQEQQSKYNEFLFAEMGEFLASIEIEEEEERTAYRDKQLEQLWKIHKILNKVYDSKKNLTTYSWFIKFVKIYGKICRMDPVGADLVFLEHICDNLANKVKEYSASNSANLMLEALFTLFDYELHGLITIRQQQKQSLNVLFQETLQFISPLGFLNYLHWLEVMLLESHRQQYSGDLQSNVDKRKQLENPHKQLQFLVKQVEIFYIKTSVQKHANVIAEYLKFFSRLIGLAKSSQRFGHGTEHSAQITSTAKGGHSRLYSKMIEDLSQSIAKIRPASVCDIIVALGNLKIDHAQVFEYLANLIQREIMLYKKEYTDIIFNYAKLGFTQDFAVNLTTSLIKLFVNRDMQLSDIEKPVQLAWGMIVLGMDSHPLFTQPIIGGFFQSAEKLVVASQTGEVMLGQIDDVYNYLRLFRPELIDKGFREIMQKYITKRIRASRDIEAVSKILLQDQAEISQEEGEEASPKAGNDNSGRSITGDKKQNLPFYRRNVVLDDNLVANLYCESKKVAILFENSFYVNYDRQSQSGYSIIRQKLFSKLAKDRIVELKVISINEWQILNLQSVEDRFTFLKKLGVPLQSY